MRTECAEAGSDDSSLVVTTEWAVISGIHAVLEYKVC